MHSDEHDEAHRETGTSGVAQEKAAMDVHLSARTRGRYWFPRFNDPQEEAILA